MRPKPSKSWGVEGINPWTNCLALVRMYRGKDLVYKMYVNPGANYIWSPFPAIYGADRVEIVPAGEVVGE